jgi:hypothetical protein
VFFARANPKGTNFRQVDCADPNALRDHFNIAPL